MNISSARNEEAVGIGGLTALHRAARIVSPEIGDRILEIDLTQQHSYGLGPGPGQQQSEGQQQTQGQQETQKSPLMPAGAEGSKPAGGNA